MQFDHYSIRLLSINDIDAYFRLVESNRKRLEDYFTGTVSKTKTLEDTRAFVVENLRRVEEKTYYPFILIDELTGQIAGFMDLKNIDWSIPKAEMGMYMDQDYANKRLASNAFNLFCTYCFDVFKFRKLFLRTHQHNLAARSLAEKCGFEIEGTIRRDYKTTSGELIDLLYYGRLND